MSFDKPELQRKQLRECMELFGEIEQRVAHLKTLKIDWNAIATNKDFINQLHKKANKIKPEIDGWSKKLSKASGALDGFDKSLPKLAQELFKLRGECRLLYGFLFAQSSIANKEVNIGHVYNPANIFDVRLVLLLVAEDQRNRVHTQIKEIKEINADPRNGPVEIDLQVLEVGIQDIDNEISMYREKLADPDPNWAINAIPGLTSMIEKMVGSLQHIQDCRQNHVTETLIAYTLANIDAKEE